MWANLFAEHGNVDSFNTVIVPLMRAEGGEFKQAAAAEAKRRRYHACKEQGVYVEMKLTKGRNLIRVGWSGSVLFAEFGSGPKVYAYPGGTQEDFFKLQRSLYPDKLFTQYKTKWEAAHE